MEKFVIIAIVMALLGGIVYWMLTHKGDNQSPTAADWALVYSANCKMQKDAAGWYFDYPVGVDGAHYCYHPAMNVKAGQTIKMDFALEGIGSIVPSPGSDELPATISLFFWGQGINDRWWSHNRVAIDGSHDFSISAQLSSDNWGGVGGNPPVQQLPFDQALAQIKYIGFTCGGSSFAGHGQMAKDAPVRFRLKSYIIQ